VDLGGFEGVRVYLENREMGVTDGEGRLMIPGLLPYQANRISINSRDLPLTARVSSTGEAVAPYYRSGLIVEFDVKETHSALLRVMMPDGTPAPEGAQAQVVGSPQLYPMGRNGRLYLQDLVGDSRVLVTTQTWQCMLQLPKPSPAQGEAISNLGEFTCVAETI
jgi:outer membrane usher protein